MQTLKTREILFTVFFPFPVLVLTGSADIEFKDVGGGDARFRLSAGYDVFLNGPLAITQRIAVDFGDGDESIVFGVTAMYGF